MESLKNMKRLINENPELRVPGIDLPEPLWTTLYRFRTEQGKFNTLMQKWENIQILF